MNFEFLSVIFRFSLCRLSFNTLRYKLFKNQKAHMGNRNKSLHFVMGDFITGDLILLGLLLEVRLLIERFLFISYLLNDKPGIFIAHIRFIPVGFIFGCASFLQVFEKQFLAMFDNIIKGFSLLTLNG